MKLLPYGPEGESFRLHEALERLGGDEELLHQMATMFVDDLPLLIEQLRSAAESENAEEAARTAHSIKGLASNFDAFACIATALRVEQLARMKRFEDVLVESVQLGREVDRVIQGLQCRVLHATRP